MAKKICAIVSLSLVGVLLIVAIIMANIDVNHNIEYKEPTRIYVQYKGNEKTTVTDAQKTEILKLLDNNEESYLNALFNKTLKEKPALITDRTTTISISTPADFYVIFYYENPQKLEGENYTYRQLVFTVSSVDEKAEVKVYICPETEMKYSKYYAIDTNYIDLYNYLVDCGYNG